MAPRQEHGIADLRGLPRKARESSNRFADEDLRLQNRQLLASRDASDRERQKYFELFEFSPDAYFITDTHGAIREANVAASQLLGIPAQFLAGKRLPNFFEESAKKAYRHQIDQLCGSERSGDWEIYIQSATGYPTAVSISIGRIPREGRSIAGYRWIVRDITKRRKAELAVREANRLNSEFLALLSHEFRTPLQAVFGYTELLDAEIHGELNQAQRRYVHRIKQSQQHLLDLIDTILQRADTNS
jgi:PAS domain S-box-containing protein